VDLRAGELRRAGLKVKLSGQPFDVLVALLEKPGQVVTREELHEKLWAQDTFVDFEHGLNKAINRVREALGDDADNPRFVETLPRRGYRFVALVMRPVPELAIDAALQSTSPSPVTVADDIPDRNRENTKKLAYYTVALTVVFIALLAGTRYCLGKFTCWRKFPRLVEKLFVFRRLWGGLGYWTSRPMGASFCWQIKQRPAQIPYGFSHWWEDLLGALALR